MIRWLVVLLILVNIMFFSLMQWGGKLGGDNPQPLPALNPEKIKLLGAPTVAPVTVVPPSAVAQPAATALIAPAVPMVPVSRSIVPPSVPVSASDAHDAENKCMEWGEFSGTDLVRAEKALAQLKLGDKLTQRTVEYARGYWVYIPPIRTHASRVKKVQQLKELGVEDYFVVQESGTWMNAISLGVFKSEEAAKHFLEELNKRGVRSAKVGERASKLKFTVFMLKRVDEAATEQLTGWQKDYAGSELKTTACN